jgi:hypothetical protein
MAHFARLDNYNTVVKVEVVNNEVITDSDGNEQEQVGVDFLTTLYGGGWYKQTSYNGNFRKNYAGVGYTYDATRDAFIAPQPYSSWALDETTCQWEAPVPHPEVEKDEDGNPTEHYTWDEETTNWVEVE